MALRDLKKLNEPQVRKLSLSAEELLDAISDGVDNDFLIKVGFAPEDIVDLDMAQVVEALEDLMQIHSKLREFFEPLLQEHYTDSVIMATINAVGEMLDELQEDDPELVEHLLKQIEMVLNDR